MSEESLGRLLDQGEHLSRQLSDLHTLVVIVAFGIVLLMGTLFILSAYAVNRINTQMRQFMSIIVQSLKGARERGKTIKTK
jgi:type II secretory pathway pseudopilin PulG